MRYTLEDHALASAELRKDLSLRLIVERFQILSHIQFPLKLTLTWVVYVLFTKTPSVHNALGVEDFMQSLHSFLISLLVTCTLMS